MAAAPPDLVPASRRSAADLARLGEEISDRHSVTLESMLAILRSPQLSDQAARSLAIDVAAAGLVELRTQTDEHRDAILEPVVGAFERLRSDLRPLVRFGELDVQFVEPPSSGRALPGEVAHAARAMVRSAVLAFVDAGEARRVRIQWDCDGLNLLVRIRDDGRGDLTVQDDAMRPIGQRVAALDGTVVVSSTPGWGSEVQITLPLDPPAPDEPLQDQEGLSPREREVLRLLAEGRRNKEIAEALGVSVNTIKFHVSKLLRKTGARTRAEIAAIAR
ncbi:LuxR C-terminal-related transcriptional regulator [Agrococcus terreus]|uniref:helix-turn-helix transcriptional regulator n=1 Tax=Agrococcus terreus TaxID=574649 RepID=UPI00384C1F89